MRMGWRLFLVVGYGFERALKEERQRRTLPMLYPKQPLESKNITKIPSDVFLNLMR